MINSQNLLNTTIYLDHNATTNIHPQVKKHLLKIFSLPINPSSTHQFGRLGYDIMNLARKQILDLLGKRISDEYDIVFTASGTEANNMIIKNFLSDGEIFVSSIEHPSILKFTLENKNVVPVQVDENGYLDLNELERKLKTSQENFTLKKRLVSVMLANNLSGVIQKDFKNISYLAKKYNALLHTDITQCLGKIDVGSFFKFDVDFATISAHKFGGLIGAGALVKKKKSFLKPILIGGEQENNLRSGTENIFAISSLGEISKIAKIELKNWESYLKHLRNHMEHELYKNHPDIKIVHQKSLRLPNTSLIISGEKKSEIQVMEFDLHNIALSSGSACFSKKKKETLFLQNAGFTEKEASSSIRVSIGINNNECDIKKFVEIYTKINKKHV